MAGTEGLSRQARIDRFGIDVGDGLEWGGGTWGPGGDYVKHLIVKNLSGKIQKIKYKLPATKFFNMDFPEVIVLSPGVHATIEVRFRPIRLEPYDDFIEFVTEGGRFRVSLRARLSKLVLSVPPALDFAFCPVNEITTATFVLSNVGQIAASYVWAVQSPFALSPSAGVLKPGSTVTITASFHPREACVLNAAAVCRAVGEQDTMTLQVALHGVGKFPFLAASASEIDVGDVLVGAPDTAINRTLVLTNPSLVPATFQVHCVESDRAPQFLVAPMSGVVPAGGTQTLALRCLPHSAGLHTVDTFEVTTPGGNTVKFSCKAHIIGPAITIARKEAPPTKATATRRPGKSNSLNFGDVQLGETVTRVLFLNNASNVPAYFHFQADAAGVFHFDKVQGIVPALLQTHVVVSFTPTEPSNFYRRVFCLIRDQSPVFVDLIGTAYDDKHRPAPLLQRHIDAYRNRPAALLKASPDQIDEIVKHEGKFDPTLEQEEAAAARAMQLCRSGQATVGELDVLEEFFIEPTEPALPVGLDVSTVDFGAGIRGGSSEKHVVNITNRCKAKITVLWRVPMSPEGTVDFAVSPETCDIAPGRSGEFRISFRPTRDNYYFASQLEAYAFCKSNRTFRLVNDESFTPPWCVTLTAIGHTFPGSGEQFLPKVSLNLPGTPSRILFPPAHVGEAVYQTFQLTNTSDIPAAFTFLPDSTGVFTVKPSSGLIPLNTFQLITVRFVPRLATTYRSTITCMLNNSRTNAAQITVEGAGCFPKVQLQDNGVVYFKPTNVGVTSNRMVNLTNVSRIPVRFEWVLPARAAGQLAVSPVSGILGGNETIACQWAFAPAIAEPMSFRVPCRVYHSGIAPHGDGEVGAGPAQQLFLHAMGAGVSGALRFDPPQVDFGTALVATHVNRTLVLENVSDCTLGFALGAVTGPDATPLQLTTGPKVSGVLHVSQLSGRIDARSRLLLRLTYTPEAARAYGIRLFYTINNAEDPAALTGAVSLLNAAAHSTSYRAACAAPAVTRRVNADGQWCRIVASAGYPTLTFQDARLLAPSSASVTAHGGGEAGVAASQHAMATSRSVLGVDPLLSETEAAVSGVSPWALWKQFQLRDLNVCLSTPLNDRDLAFNRATQLTQDPNELNTFSFEFTPAVLGSSAQTLLLSVCNTGLLHTEFSFRLPNELEIELEPWAESGEPTDKDLAQNAIIDAKLFELQPRKGSLAPGESTTLRLQYSYNSLMQNGMHSLPVILKLEKGKQVRIMLTGHTLEPNMPLLWLGDPTSRFELAAVPIGTMEPPVQHTTLYNPSLAYVSYMVDDGAINALNNQNYNFRVLSCLDPTGTIPPGGQTDVRFVFQPLEAKVYQANVEIVFTMNGESEAGGVVGLSIIGEGVAPVLSEDGSAAPNAPAVLGVLTEGLEETDEPVDTEELRRAAQELARAVAVVKGEAPPTLEVKDEDDLPLPTDVLGTPASETPVVGTTPPFARKVAMPSANIPEAMAILSVEWARFGQLPQRSVSTRLVIVRNMRPSGSVEFFWDPTVSLIANGVARVFPAAGRLKCGAQMVCKVVLHAPTSPEVIESDLKCVVTIPADEMRATAEAQAKVMRDAALRARTVRHTASVSPALQQSVVFRTTASQQARLATGKPRGGVTMTQQHTGPSAGFPVGPNMYSTEDVARPASMARMASTSGSRLGGTSGTRSMRSLGSRGVSDTLQVEVAQSPVLNLLLRVSARVCSEQEFLLMHPRSRLAAYFRSLPAEAEVVTIDQVMHGLKSANAANNEDAHASNTPLEAALFEDVLSRLVQDAVADADVATAFGELQTDPIPLFSQLPKYAEASEPTPRSRRGSVHAAAAAHNTAAAAAAPVISTEDRLLAMRCGECRSLIDKVLEDTVANLMREIVVGEFDATKPPRSVVRL